LISANIDGILLKRSATGQELERAVQSLKQGKSYFSEEVADRIRQLSLVKKSLLKLSAREMDVLRLICDGLSTKEVATNLSLSPSTIEDYRKALLSKTNVKNTAELIALAHRSGLLN
jgi:two-component system, NarL family, response regulator DegU